MSKQPRKDSSDAAATRVPAWTRVAAFVALIALLAVLNAHFGWSDNIMGTDTVKRMQTAVATHPV